MAELTHDRLYEIDALANRVEFLCILGEIGSHTEEVDSLVDAISELQDEIERLRRVDEETHLLAAVGRAELIRQWGMKMATQENEYNLVASWGHHWRDQAMAVWEAAQEEAGNEQ